MTETFSTSGRIGLVVAGLIAVVALLAIVEPGSSLAGRILLGYQRTVDTISEGLGWVAKWLVPIVVVVGFGNVLLRYIGRWQNRALTSNRYVELQWMLFGAIFLLVFPYVLKHGINVRVDFIYQRFSRKIQALIDFVGHLLSLVPYCLFAIWVVWDYALTSLFQRSPRWDTWQVWDVWEKSQNAGGLSPAPIKVLILVGLRLPPAADRRRADQARFRPRREGAARRPGDPRRAVAGRMRCSAPAELDESRGPCRSHSEQ